MGHFVKPTSQNSPIADRAPFLRQHEKRRLKRIFRIVMLAKHMATNAQHHRPVALDQCPERFLRLRFLAVQEPLEQVFVREFVGDRLHSVLGVPLC